MALPITERIAELRKEIAEIQSANRLASTSLLPYQDLEAMKQKRAERLQEIMAELRTPAEWKKAVTPRDSFLTFSGKHSIATLSSLDYFFHNNKGRQRVGSSCAVRFFDVEIGHRANSWFGHPRVTMRHCPGYKKSIANPVLVTQVLREVRNDDYVGSGKAAGF